MTRGHLMTMSRLLLLAALAMAGIAGDRPEGKDAKQQEQAKEKEKEKAPPPELTPEEPPEEDASLAEKEYAFNPLQAQKEMTVGNFYYKKGSYAAAALRYVEATRWNPAFADAFLRLAETYEKLERRDKARETYQQFLAMAPDHKRAAEVKKKLGQK
ncbi:MAG: tetratricopeptide repeat protein [Bryobacteraceae bacterium]